MYNCYGKNSDMDINDVYQIEKDEAGYKSGYENENFAMKALLSTPDLKHIYYRYLMFGPLKVRNRLKDMTIDIGIQWRLKEGALEAYYHTSADNKVGLEIWNQLFHIHSNTMWSLIRQFALQASYLMEPYTYDEMIERQDATPKEEKELWEIDMENERHEDAMHYRQLTQTINDRIYKLVDDNTITIDAVTKIQSLCELVSASQTVYYMFGRNRCLNQKWEDLKRMSPKWQTN